MFFVCVVSGHALLIGPPWSLLEKYPCLPDGSDLSLQPGRWTWWVSLHFLTGIVGLQPSITNYPTICITLYKLYVKMLKPAVAIKQKHICLQVDSSNHWHLQNWTVTIRPSAGGPLGDGSETVAMASIVCKTRTQTTSCHQRSAGLPSFRPTCDDG